MLIMPSQTRINCLMTVLLGGFALGFAGAVHTALDVILQTGLASVLGRLIWAYLGNA
jgi:ABC-type transport system involved in cytochrome c biogenesis permease component